MSSPMWKRPSDSDTESIRGLDVGLWTGLDVTGRFVGDTVFGSLRLTDRRRPSPLAEEEETGGLRAAA
jgi:hypothetical protein